MILSDVLKSILLGVVEGVTEWLPVSSTAHLILLGEFVGFGGVSAAFGDVFEVVVQLGAAAAVAVLYRDRFALFRRSSSGAFVPRRELFALWGKAAIACVPAVFAGLFLDDLAEARFHGPLCVAAALAAVGAAFILVERVRRGKAPRVRSVGELTVRDAAAIGVCQAVSAIFPGTSRSGSTILGALALGVDRGAAAEFTFLLAVPVMAGASLLRLAKAGFALCAAELAVLAAGTLTAFLVSLASIRFLVGFVRRHGLAAFGVYRLILAAVVILRTLI